MTQEFMSQEKKLLVKPRFCNRKWNYSQDRIFLGTNLLVLVSFQREIASVQILHRVYKAIKSNIPLPLLPVIRIFCIPILLHEPFLNLVKFDIDILHNKFLFLSNNNPSLPVCLCHWKRCCFVLFKLCLYLNYFRTNFLSPQWSQVCRHKIEFQFNSNQIKFNL